MKSTNEVKTSQMSRRKMMQSAGLASLAIALPAGAQCTQSGTVPVMPTSSCKNTGSHPARPTNNPSSENLRDYRIFFATLLYGIHFIGDITCQPGETGEQAINRVATHIQAKNNNISCQAALSLANSMYSKASQFGDVRAAFVAMMNTYTPQGAPLIYTEGNCPKFEATAWNVAK